MADVKKMKMDIVDKSDEIAKALSQGKDIVITKSPTGIVVKKLTVQKVWDYAWFIWNSIIVRNGCFFKR